MTVDLTIPAGAFAPDYCTSCGDFSGDYNLTGIFPTLCFDFTYTENNYCVDPDCDCGDAWDLYISAGVRCRAPDYYCSWSLIVAIRHDRFGWNQFLQEWTYGYDWFPGSNGEQTLSFESYRDDGQVREPCPPNAGELEYFYPYDKDSYPDTLTVTPVIT